MTLIGLQRQPSQLLCYIEHIKALLKFHLNEGLASKSHYALIWDFISFSNKQPNNRKSCVILFSILVFVESELMTQRASSGVSSFTLKHCDEALSMKMRYRWCFRGVFSLLHSTGQSFCEAIVCFFSFY